MTVWVSMTTITLSDGAIPASYTAFISTSTTRANFLLDKQDAGGGDGDIDGLFDMIMNEIGKIEKNESYDISYTKIILGLLVLLALFTIRTKMYRGCCRRWQRHYRRSRSTSLQGITIHYNVTAPPPPMSTPSPIAEAATLADTQAICALDAISLMMPHELTPRRMRTYPSSP
ncbi:hypothetical protein [Alphabaculovirus myunipunctae]|uniref:Uncharacterized protein n=1 Tax=Mythimna unipuncta nucleopolyhedrovirus TaxID=447897 RepID=A0A2K9VS46_9ABAC|nr:hypothetical protein [Mythimna unipuncta nucleopolyhedrovirus]AUV65278.1 hypothetical protein [Mythimna unipuncta nucleopolyhedrovirus]